MSVLTDVKSRVSGVAQAEKERYSGTEERPLGGYLAAMGAYAAATTALVAAARLTRRELITCPFCIDMWVATGLMADFIYLPRTTRLAIDTLVVLAGADLLQFGYSWLQEQEQS